MPKRLIGRGSGFDGSELGHNGDPTAHPGTVLPALTYVNVNLHMLGRLLNLTQVERMWLQTAYRWTRFPDHQPDPVAADRDAVLALLSERWSVPLDSVVAATRPNRLRALRMLEPVDSFVDGCAGAGEHRLRDWLRCTEHLNRLVEVPRRSHASLLNGLLNSAPDWLLNRLACSPDADTAVDLNRLPKSVADAYQCDHSGLPLTADHIAALVLWFGDWSVPAARFDVLAGHVTVTTVRDALQLAVFRCCQLQTPLTEFALLKALFASCD
jgi:hypothetical protein